MIPASFARFLVFASILCAPTLAAAIPAAFAAEPPQAEPAAPLVRKCLDVWAKKHHPQGGPLTLFSYEIKDRGSYKIVEMRLGSGEGRTTEGSCRVNKDGEITHTYE
jgi:hypothetical protein